MPEPLAAWSAVSSPHRPRQRTGRVQGITGDSAVLVELNLDGEGRTSVETGIPILDHLLTQFGHHGGFDEVISTRTLWELFAAGPGSRCRSVSCRGSSPSM